jgi:hypothetical protein
MTDKAIISDYTYRTLASQRANCGDMPVFILPDDLQHLFRPTTRKTNDRFHVDSLAVLAKKEAEFRDFLSEAKKRKIEIVSREDNKTFIVNGNCENIVKWWKDARRNGVAKIGAKISSDAKKAITKAAVEKIRDRWPLPSNQWPTSTLLAEADLSLNTVKSVLGPRPIVQYNYRTMHGRQIKQVEMSDAPREEMDFCGLYVFKIERNVYKIGVSGDARRRFKDISQYHKKQMKVEKLFTMDIEKAYAVESEVHNRLRKYLAHEYKGREIFRVSLETIKRAVKRAITTVTTRPTYE